MSNNSVHSNISSCCPLAINFFLQHRPWLLQSSFHLCSIAFSIMSYQWKVTIWGLWKKIWLFTWKVPKNLSSYKSTSEFNKIIDFKAKWQNELKIHSLNWFIHASIICCFLLLSNILLDAYATVYLFTSWRTSGLFSVYSDYK